MTIYNSIPADQDPEDERTTPNLLESKGRSSAAVSGPSHGGISMRRGKSAGLGINLMDGKVETTTRAAGRAPSAALLELTVLPKTSDPFDELLHRPLDGIRAASQPELSSPRGSAATRSIDDLFENKASNSDELSSSPDPNDVGYSHDQRELHIYALPLLKDRLVYLPVCTWKDDPDSRTLSGKVVGTVNKMHNSITHYWESLGRTTPGSFGHRVYQAGQVVLNNLSAEERLMRDIPRHATKLIVHHPAKYSSDEVQTELTTLTSNFCYKSAGKATLAGVMLPVAVGLECFAVPGIGWFTAYQLFKSTTAAAGGSRLNNYLQGPRMEVRVCYVPEVALDTYVMRSRLSPDGLLGQDDIEDLAHDLRVPSLVHPLTELRSRRLRKDNKVVDGYALLPLGPPEGEGSVMHTKRD